MDEPTFVPAVFYRDPKAALGFLEKAFGFEVSMAIEGPDGDPSQCHYEMTMAGAGRLMIGGEWADWIRSPSSNGGTTCQSVHVEVTTDVDEHCEHARGAGATITFEPKDEFYGDRVYRAADLEGHSWTFHQHIRDVPRAEAESAIGQPIDAPGWGVSNEALTVTPLDRTLAALSDVRRRRAIELLRDGPRRAGDLAAALDLTPSAMSRHLKVLRRAGLVTESNPDTDARVRVYGLRPDPTDELAAWLERTREGWTEQLTELKHHVEGDR